MTDTPEPIVINPSAVPDVIGTIVRDIAIATAAFPVIAKLVGAHDIAGLVAWLSSDAAKPLIALVVAIGLTAWRARKAFLRKAKLVIVGRAAPDSVATVTEATPPPAAA